MRSCIILAGVALAAAADVRDTLSPTYFQHGDVPKCYLIGGHTVVHYTGKHHPSFLCRAAADKSSCTCHKTDPVHGSVHPTHHFGLPGGRLPRR